MNSLMYLVLRSAKNSLLELLKKPARLVMYLLVILFVTGMALVSFRTSADTSGVAPMFWLKGAVFAFLAFLCTLTVIKGTSAGNSFFDMNDVNFLFVSPVSPRKILLYGIVRLMRMSFLSAFFVLFQTQTIGANFGVGFGGVMAVFLSVVLSMAVSAILSLAVYCLTNGRPGRQRAVKVIATLMLVPFAAVLVSGVLRGVGLAEAAEAAIGSPALRYVPVAGWMAEGVTAWLSGRAAAGLILFGLTAALGAGAVLLITLSRADYYEDVLCATETAFERKRALQEGNVQAAGAGANKRVKVKGTGIRGFGLAALLGKHLRESFRERRLGILGIQTLFYLALTVALAYFLPDSAGLIPIAGLLMWLQIMLIGMGHGLKEIYLHYLYMIPASPFKKILWNSAEILLKTAIESAVLFTAAGILMNTGVLQTVCAALAYLMFTLYLLGINYMSVRWTGAEMNAGLLVLVYMAAVFLGLLPGLIPGLVIGLLVGGQAGIVLGLFIVAVWELIAAVIAFALARGALHNCDMPVMRTMK